MGYREPVSGLKDTDGLPVLALPPGTVMRRGYQMHFLALGGMSLCYRGDLDGKTYFLKEVATQDAREVMALNQEKGLLERFDHPAIVKVHQLFEEDGFYYLVLDFVEGQSLDRLVSPFPDNFLQDQVVADWGRQLCDVLGYLHRQEPVVIYRDLKPRNVVKDHQGRLHLVDFGIARLFKEGKSKDTEALGSALTASPEHYSGQTDVRSDVYSLGATLHYLLTNGRCPRESPFEFSPPRSVNPRMSAALEQVVMKALEVDPARRWQTMAEFDLALAACFGPAPVQAARSLPAVERTVALPRPPAPTRPTPPWMWALMGSLATAVVVGILWLTNPPGPGPVAASPEPSVPVAPAPVNPPPVAVRPAPSPVQPDLVNPSPVTVHPDPSPVRPAQVSPAPVAVRPDPPPAPPLPVAVPPPPPVLPPPAPERQPPQPVVVVPPAPPPRAPESPAPETLRDWLGDARRSDVRSLRAVQGDLVEEGGVRVLGDGFAVVLPEGYVTSSPEGSDDQLFLGGVPRQPATLRMIHCRRLADQVDLEQLAQSHLELAREHDGSQLVLSLQGQEVKVGFRLKLEVRGRLLEVQGRERLIQGRKGNYSIVAFSPVVSFPRHMKELEQIMRSFETK